MEKQKKKRNGRVKREECSKTKHDAFFSPWKIIVGPSDWDDHRSGKEGAHRYRIHNLPENFPGLYELGIAKPSTGFGTSTRSNDLKDIMVVYLGQADNVRTRLQHYGRTGSHLECGKQDPLAKGGHVKVKEEPGLFREVFARGCSIAFRCVPMKNKLEAEKREAQLLDYFDYAWNQIYNGSCRREEILSKLEKKLSSSQMSSAIHHKFQALKRMLSLQKQVGVRIDNSVLFDEYIMPEVRKVGKSWPQVLQPDTEVPLTTTPSENICGIALGDGSVCAKTPTQGRKRCEDHKGRRIVETKKDRLSKNNVGCDSEQAWINVCGVISEIDGSSCKNPPAAGRKRCEDHKGRRKTTKQILVPVY